MLVARGSLGLAHVKWRWSLTFATRFWATLVEQDGIVLDTDFIPATSDPVRPGRCLFLVANGSWESGSVTPKRLEGPVAILMSEEQLDGVSGRRPVVFRAEGHPFAAIEMHVAEGDLRTTPAQMPCSIPLGEETWARVRRAIAAALGGDDGTTITTMTDLLDALADEGVLSPVVARSSRERVAYEVLWKALRPMVERFALSPTLAELTGLAGVTARQLERQIRAFIDRFGHIGFAGSGWRLATSHLRIKLAVMLLSAQGISVAEVAARVGYGSTDAMGRAFRNAGLRAPTLVQAAMHARHARDG